MLRRHGWLVALSVFFGAGCDRCGTSAAEAPPALVRLEIAWAGAAPVDVERELTLPLEAALQPLPGVRRVASTSDEGHCELALEVDDGPAALVAVRRALEHVVLPSEADLPVLTIARAEPVRLETSALPERGPSLVDGVTFGARRREIVVEVAADRLQARGLSLSEVEAALAVNEASAGGGVLAMGDSLVRVITHSDSVHDLAERRVREDVRISDVATVSDGFADGPWVRAVDERVTLTARSAPTGGVSFRRWGAIPRIVGPAVVVLVEAPSDDGAMIERVVVPLLEAAAPVPGVRWAVALHGQSVWGGPRASRGTELLVMADSVEAARAAVAAIERAAQERPGVRVAGFVQGDRWLRITVRGETRERVDTAAARIDAWLEEQPGADAIWRTTQPLESALNVTVRPAEATRHGIRSDVIARTIQLATTGIVVAELHDGAERVDVVLRLAGVSGDVQALSRVTVAADSGAHVPLSQIADLTHDLRAASTRVDGMPATERFVRVRDPELEHALEELELPPGVQVELSR